MADKKSIFYDQISEEDKKWIELFDLQPKEEVTFSRHFMINMNRIFRECGSCRKIPFPEVDTIFERFRSKWAVCIRKK